MRTILTVGAIICFIIAVFLFFTMMVEILKSPSLFPENPWNYFALVLELTIIFLAFAPTLMLVQCRRIEKPRVRFFLIGLVELIVIGLVLAMLFPHL
jgi:hypothetical protein